MKQGIEKLFYSLRLIVMAVVLMATCLPSMAKVVTVTANVRSGQYKDDSSITEVVIQSGVTIGAQAFMGCVNLTKVTIEGRLETTLEPSAFYKCRNLKTIEKDSFCKLHCGAYAFANTGLVSLDLLNWTFYRNPYTTWESAEHYGIDTWGSGDAIYVFMGCSNLTSVKFGGLLDSSLNKGMFYNCTKLGTLDFKYSGVGIIGESAFLGCPISTVDFGDVTEVRDYGLYGNHLTNIDLTGFSFLGYHAFSPDDKFTTPKKLKIGKCSAASVFRYPLKDIFGKVEEVEFLSEAESVIPLFARFNTDIKKVTFNSGVKIGRGAFLDCTSLEEATFYNNTFDASAFEGCSSLTKVTLNNMPGEGWSFKGNEYIQSVRFNNLTPIPAEAFRNCTSLTTISGVKVKKVGDYAFDGCTSLTSGHLSEYAEFVGNYAFRNCANLTTPGSGMSDVESIGDYAFAGCTKLTYVDMIGSPDLTNCTHIGAYAFSDCTDKDLSFNGICAPYIGECAFKGCCGKIRITCTSLDNFIGGDGNNSPLCGSRFNEIILTKMTALPDYLFYDIPTLTRVEAYQLTSINPKAFCGCPMLEDLVVNNKTIKWHSRNGNLALYTADYSTLLYVPAGSNYVTLHKNCTKVDAEAFINYYDTTAFGEYCPVKTLDCSEVENKVTFTNKIHTNKLPAAIKIPYGRRADFASFVSGSAVEGLAAKDIPNLITDYIKGDVNEDAKVSNADAQGVYMEIEKAD